MTFKEKLVTFFSALLAILGFLVGYKLKEAGESTEKDILEKEKEEQENVTDSISKDITEKEKEIIAQEKEVDNLEDAYKENDTKVETLQQSHDNRKKEAEEFIRKI